MSTGASLLGVPREVRSMILREVSLIPWPAPRHPTCLLNQKRRVIHETETGAWMESHRVSFEESPVPNPVLPLLLTNRQLHDETRDMLTHEFAKQLPNYTIDVVYLKDCTLWPTWLSVPVRASHVDSVTAQFRLFNCPDDMRMTSEPRRDMFRMGCGAPEAVVWPFYHLLIAAGKFGPCGLPITMRRLVLDFLPAEEDDILPLGLATFRKGRTEDFYETRLPSGWTPPRDPNLIAPAMMMNFVRSELEGLLQLCVSTFDYGKKLYESIGEIEIRLAGKVYVNLDFAESLASASSWVGNPYSYTQVKRDLDFNTWRPQVEARRRKLGMPVKDSS